MKSREWGIIAVIVIVSSVASLFIARAIFGGGDTSVLKSQVVEPIPSSISLPDKTYFNDQSINPTTQINIGEDSNPTPFNDEN